MIDDSIRRALSSMKLTINQTMVDFDSLSSSNQWNYYISIYARDEQSLVYASELVKLLNVRSKSILLITESYKRCSFDCVIVTDIFRCTRETVNYNVDTVTIIEDSAIEFGDFRISILRKNEKTSSNDIMLYSLSSTINQ